MQFPIFRHGGRLRRRWWLGKLALAAVGRAEGFPLAGGVVWAAGFGCDLVLLDIMDWMDGMDLVGCFYVGGVSNPAFFLARVRGVANPAHTKQPQPHQEISPLLKKRCPQIGGRRLGGVHVVHGVHKVNGLGGGPRGGGFRFGFQALERQGQGFSEHWNAARRRRPQNHGYKILVRRFFTTDHTNHTEGGDVPSISSPSVCSV